MPSDQITLGPETAAMARLADRLTGVLRTLVLSSPLAGLGPIEVARTVGVDKTLVSRLMAALRAPDALAALSALPGTGPLRQFITATRQHGADPAAADAAEQELRTFDRELQRTFGTRTRLDAVIADALPQSRRRHQESARQAVYRGMALIKGVSIDHASVTWIVYPGSSQGAVDIAVVASYTGVRRLRPSARVRLGSSHKTSRPDRPAGLLSAFCRPADLRIESTRDGEHSFYEISTGPVRRDASADVVLTETIHAGAPREGPCADRPRSYGCAVVYAFKRLTLSMIVDEAVWPGCGFTARAYDTALRGIIGYPDSSHESDRLPLEAPVTGAHASDEVLSSTRIPRFGELVRHIAEPLGVRLPRARMFCCDMVYPVYGSQVMLLPVTQVG